MKTFKDLKFKKHSGFPSLSTQARIFFENGYGASVITGEHAYSDESHPYELAVLYGNEKESFISYNTDIANDVVGHLNEDGVTEVLKQIQKLTK